MKNGANLRLVTPLNVKLEDLTVSDLFRPNSLDWDVELLGELFLPRDVKEICNLPPRGSNGIDKIVCILIPSGVTLLGVDIVLLRRS